MACSCEYLVKRLDTVIFRSFKAANHSCKFGILHFFKQCRFLNKYDAQFCKYVHSQKAHVKKHEPRGDMQVEQSLDADEC